MSIDPKMTRAVHNFEEDIITSAIHAHTHMKNIWVGLYAYAEVFMRILENDAMIDC